jgi:hypothetical protein
MKTTKQIKITKVLRQGLILFVGQLIVDGIPAAETTAWSHEGCINQLRFLMNKKI